MGIRNIQALFPGDEFKVEEPGSINVTDLGDGSFRVSGSDEQVKMLDETHFQITSPTVTDLGAGTYTASG